MAVTVAQLLAAKFAENSQTTQYTSTNVTTKVTKFTAANQSAGTVTFAVNIVPSAGAAGAGNLRLPTKSILAGEVYHCPEVVGTVLPAGSFISTLCGTASALVIEIDGLQIT